MPDRAVWNKELLFGAITVAWGQEQGTWGPVLLLVAGLTGQDGTDSPRPVNFPGCSSCSTASGSALSPGTRCPGSSCAQAGLCLPGFGALADVLSPWQHSPASRAAPALLFHTHGRGLEAVGLSPVVVPGAALAASSPLPARSSSLPPPVSSLALNRPVPACLFATSWHCCSWHRALLPSHPVRHLLSVGSCGTAWVPCALCCAHDTDAAAVGVSLAAQGGPVLPLPVRSG